MEVEATIKRVFTKRTFTTDKGQFTTQPLLLEAKEQRQMTNGSIFELNHSFIAELTGKNAGEFNLSANTNVVVGLHFIAREGKNGNDKYFQSIRITYLRVQQCDNRRPIHRCIQGFDVLRSKG